MNTDKKNLTLPSLSKRVGVAAFDDKGRLLLIKRGNPPAVGLWTIPMGKVEAGETLRQAAIREVFEETHVKVRLGNELGKFHANGVELRVFLGSVLKGKLRAGDDAIEAQMVYFHDIASLEQSNRYEADEWAYHMNDQIFEKLTLEVNRLGRIIGTNERS